MRVALYARVSTDKSGQNPETQLFRLRQIAQARGWEVCKVYMDFKSGKDPNRPAFQEMMKAAKVHEFDLIFVTRLDRMMRSTKNLFNILEELKHYKVGFECSERESSTKGAMGKLMLTMLSAIAEFERELTVERSKEGTARAKAEGRYVTGLRGRSIPRNAKRGRTRGRKRGSFGPFPFYRSQHKIRGQLECSSIKVPPFISVKTGGGP